MMLGKSIDTMSLPEFIGFIITLVFLFFFYVKQIFEKTSKEPHPEKYTEEEDEDEELREFLEALHIDKESYKNIIPESKQRALPPEVQKHIVDPPKPAPLTEHTKFHFDVGVEGYKQRTKVETVDVGPKFVKELKVESTNLLKGSEINPYLSSDRHSSAYDLDARFRPSKGKKILFGSSDLKKQMIIKEILGKPKAFE